jgi:hypothetical protein
MDLARPYARALAVSGGLVVAVGTEDEASSSVPAGTPRIDLDLCEVIPGFHDAHTHLSGGAEALAGLDLRNAPDSAAVVEAVRKEALRLEPSAWVRGFGWDETRWPPHDRPTRDALDAAAPGRPVLLSRVDGHTTWGNARALRASGFDPEEPTGILREADAAAARRSVPLPPPAVLADRVAGRLEEAARFGITSLEDIVEDWSLPIYRRLLADGRLRLRVGAWLPVETGDEEAEEWLRLQPPQHPHLSCGVRKGFLDGSLGSRTAALRSPYADAPYTRGGSRADLAALEERLSGLAARGWAVALHAVGDRAVAAAIDLLRGLPLPGAGRRHRIEHAQVVAPADLERLAASEAVVSVQPAQWAADRGWLSLRLGRRRDSWVHPWRRLVRAGAVVAFGSDWPVGPLDPREALSAAVRGGPGRDGETLDLETALAAHTVGPARAWGDARRGVLREGARADFTVLTDRGPVGSRDPRRFEVCATYVDGRCVWPDREDPWV